MKTNVKRLIVKSVSAVLAIALFISLYYVVYLYCGYQRVRDKLWLKIANNTEAVAPLDEPLTLLTYNVGFGAHSDDFSFFMDGGENARAFSAEAVVKNTERAIEIIKDADADFILLQEVDIDGTRSHHIDQTEMFNAELDDCDSVTAGNYDSPYFLYPLYEPIGKNKSGIMTISNYNMSSSTRRRLPVEDSLYKYLDLDRAYTVTRISLDEKKILTLYNLHLSAYTSDGKIADEQLKMLLEDMKAEYDKGRYVIAAGDFNKDLLGDSSKYFKRGYGEYNWALSIDKKLIPEGFELYAATNAPSCRSADSPYKGDGTDFVVTVDGLIASANVTVVSSETIDVGFECSDHNPVKYEIILGKAPKAE